MREKYSKMIGVRVDSQMYNEIRELADYNGIPMSQIVRRMVEKSLRDLDVEEELIYETISKL